MIDLAEDPAGSRAVRSFIIGTAGHVDHGKTELIRALTGLDTDRLKEEKERGISIELGFAPLPIDEETFIGVVDVPGHERFVKQMVSGAGGIDMAMLLVAADEGVMPQTEEHMEVLHSLRIGCGVVVISKCDLADDDTKILLADEIASLTRGTFLEGAPVVETSARTGEGLDRLRAVLKSLTATIQPRSTGGPFRLAVDRVFHQKGIGAVVTGSCYSGVVRSGDSLELLPGGREVRVRELQSFGHKRDIGIAGERLALALQGAKLEEIARGDMLCSKGRFRATEAADVRMALGEYAKIEINNRERVRVHHGACEVLGRVILLESEKLLSGQSAIVQIRLERPLVAAEGDYVVFRKYSPARVVGGGRVIDPNPDKHKRFDASALERIRIREEGDPLTVLLKTVEMSGASGVDVKGIGDALLAEAIAGGDAANIQGRLFHAHALSAIVEGIFSYVGAFLTTNPFAWGMDKEELRQKLAFPHGAQTFNAMLEFVGSDHSVFVRGNKVRVGDDVLELDDRQSRIVEELRAEVRGHGIAFPNRTELLGAWGAREGFEGALQYLKDTDAVIEVGGEGIIDCGEIDNCVAALRRMFSVNPEISVSDFKDALGLSRKYAVPLLEHFDEQRITTRKGNVRVPGPRLD